MENASQADKNSKDDLVESAQQTIIELRKEIEDLKNSSDAKSWNETPSELPVEAEDTQNVKTNDKIEIIERKFNAFEIMYMESQDKFIESFRSLDERHKVYMDNIQETIKEIVEKSLGHHADTKIQESTVIPRNENEHEREMEKSGFPQPRPEIDLEACSREPMASTDSYSQSDGEETAIVCQVDVHTAVPANANLHEADDLNSRRNTKPRNKISKDVAVNELEHRLHQFGVDADSTGLTTPRSCEVSQDLAEEREEMKKVYFFNIISIDRMAQSENCIFCVFQRLTNHSM